MTVTQPSFRHLRALTDDGGLHEHADGTTPRRAHGYCVDDVARGLLVTCRERGQEDLREQYLAFVLAAQSSAGLFRNRRNARGAWTDEPSLEDCWGRALWGLGAAIACPDEVVRRNEAVRAFEKGATHRSPHVRAMMFAALGAAQVLTVRPDNLSARSLLGDAARLICPLGTDPGWRWPEARLTYANAVVPEVLIAAGVLLERTALLTEGLTLLGWLVASETREDHLSVTPVGGRGPNDPRPAFDQQPIELAALADACARAYAVTGEPRWAEGLMLAAEWFGGRNDVGIALHDPISGGGCDGLEPHGRNENQGAESTLALISTLQQARWLSLCLT